MLNSKLLGASLLIAGTSIGAAMLALPLSSALAGFHWSVLILIVSWFFMYSTGLCIIEVESALDDRSSSFITMAKATLGKWGERLTAVCFCLLLYSLLAAYITGGGDIVQSNLNSMSEGHVSGLSGVCLWTFLFAGIVYYGVAASDRVNRLIMAGLFLSYGVLVATLSPHISLSRLALGDVHYIWVAIPIVFTAHAYHVVIPSVYHYLDNDPLATKRALIYGSLIPLILYLLWEAVVFGVLPVSGEMSLQAIGESHHTTSKLTEVFQTLSGSIALGVVSRGFVFCAIASSFLGVALGLFDLIKDAVDHHGVTLKRPVILILTFLPAMLYGILYPEGFILALNYAGIFVAILHGLLPVVMVISKRYFLHRSSPYSMEGGKFSLILLGLFYFGVIGLDIASSLSWLPQG